MTTPLSPITQPFDMSVMFGTLNMIINEINAINSQGGPVTSVNGQTGVVLLTTADIPDSTDARYVTDTELTYVALLPNISGNAATATLATTATNATNAANVATIQASTNASYFPLFVASSTNGNQACDLGTGLTFNPSTNTLSTTVFSGQLTGTIASATTATTQTPGDNSTKVATTAYVQAAVFGTTPLASCKYATTAALPAVTYSNGASGVGATLTEVGLGALSIDGSTPSVNDRVLIKNQVSTFQNGVYTVTVVGDVGVAFVLTRATDYNQQADVEIGDTTFISAGSTLSSTTWTQNGTDSPVIGTDPITFTQTAGPGSFTAGNGISITGTSIAIDTNVTVDKTTGQTLTNKTLASPTLTTPVLGTPSSGTLSSCTTATQTAGDNSTKMASTAYVNDAVNNVVINTQSDSYTLVLTDNGKFIDMTKGTASTLTIPPNSGGGSVAFPVGTQIIIRQGGAGQVTVAITTDTLNNPNATLKTRVQYSQFVITKVASTVWTIAGDAAAS